MDWIECMRVLAVVDPAVLGHRVTIDLALEGLQLEVGLFERVEPRLLLLVPE